MKKVKLIVVLVAALIGAAIGFFIATKQSGNYGEAVALGAFIGAIVGNFVFEYATD
ncbi:hypothetical protein HY967_04845 [Candidatus Jorgensenbacteria bacterium]|nr:hypothetical protein [Candidatus Jorgensenbacteria bacterium]